MPCESLTEKWKLNTPWQLTMGDNSFYMTLHRLYLQLDSLSLLARASFSHAYHIN